MYNRNPTQWQKLEKIFYFNFTHLYKKIKYNFVQQIQNTQLYIEHKLQKT